MLTLQQIFKSLYRIPPGPDGEDRFDRATRVAVSAFKRGINRKTGQVTFVAKTRTTSRVSGRLSYEIHVSSLVFLDDKHVKLSCSCSDFWSRWEYNLAQHGAADIVYGNGDAPQHKIPIGCCMHLVRLADFAVSRGFITGNFTLPK